MMDIKVLTICVLMTAQYVSGYEDVLACWKDQCRPSGQVECPDPQVEITSRCWNTVVCCPKAGNGNAKCKCFENSCPDEMEEDSTQQCSKCCSYCYCLPKGTDCPANTFNQKNQLCRDSDEFMRECCKDGACECMNGYQSDTGRSCPNGYSDRGMCKSCCETPAGYLSGW